MLVQQSAENPSQQEARIVEEMKRKKHLLDKQLEFITELERQSNEELCVWEDKCKNLRHIYNYYNLPQLPAQIPRNVVNNNESANMIKIQKEMLKLNAKNQQIDITQQPLPPQIPQINQVRQEQSLVSQKFVQETSEDLQFELPFNKVKQPVPHLKPQQEKQKDIQFEQSTKKEKQPHPLIKRIIDGVKLPGSKPDVNIPGNKANNLNTSQLDVKLPSQKIQKTPLNNPMKKIVPPSNLNTSIEKSVKKQNFPKDELVNQQSQDKSECVRLFEEHFTRYLLKFKEDSPHVFQQQLQKAIQIKSMLDVPDNKLVITPKWLKLFKLQQNRKQS